MSRYSRTATSGQVQSGEIELIWRPKSAADGAGRRGVLLAHGAGTDCSQYADGAKPGSLALGSLLAEMGYFVLAADLGGMNTMGNDTVVSRLTAAWNVLKTLGCRTDKAIGVGVSMGALSLFNAARAAAVPFPLIAGIIPLADLDDARDNDRGGLRATTNTAWSLTAGSTSSTVPLPARANPNTTTNAALIAVSCPAVYLSVSSGDTVVPAATATSLATKLTSAGVAVTTVAHGSADHSEASVLSAAQRTELVTALLAS